MPALIKFIIIWNVSLWHQPKHFSLCHSCCHIIQFAVIFQRKSHKSQIVLTLRIFCNRKQFLFCLPKKHLLIKQIPTGITGNTQLRKYQYLGTLCFCFIHQAADFFPVRLRIRHSNLRCQSRYFDKSLSHFFTISFNSSILNVYAVLQK